MRLVVVLVVAMAVMEVSTKSWPSVGGQSYAMFCYASNGWSQHFWAVSDVCCAGGFGDILEAKVVAQVFDGCIGHMLGCVLSVFGTHVPVRELPVSEVACPDPACSAQVVLWFES